MKKTRIAAAALSAAAMISACACQKMEVTYPETDEAFPVIEYGTGEPAGIISDGVPDESSIPGIVEIPDVKDHELGYAQERLEKDGFTANVVYEENGEIAENYVIRTDPPAHEAAAMGSEVVLYVSTGAADTGVTVPKFVGLPLIVAEQRAEEYDLAYRIEYRDSADVDWDIVMGQSIESGSQVEHGTEILLTVSTGKMDRQTLDFTYPIAGKPSGRFMIEYQVNGVTDETASEVLDLGVEENRMLNYTVSGSPGEYVRLRIVASSVQTGKSGTYMEVTVRFPADGGTPDYTGDYLNTNLFLELNYSDPPNAE